MRWTEFHQCPGCSFDLGTGEGEKSCHLYDCPYLPQELDVFCPQCRFDFNTGEGNPGCENPWKCENGAETLAHVRNYRVWLAAGKPA